MGYAHYALSLDHLRSSYRRRTEASEYLVDFYRITLQGVTVAYACFAHARIAEALICRLASRDTPEGVEAITSVWSTKKNTIKGTQCLCCSKRAP